MNTIFQLCPKCNNHTNIVLDKDNAHINCQCGYCTIMNVNNIMNDINQINEYKSKTFSCIINDIKKGNDHLLTYFKTLKNHYINQLKNTINEVESSYEDSINRNKNLLSFLQILIDNYDGSIKMKNNILDNEINIYKCNDNANVDDVIKYYKEYTIIEKKLNIEEVKCSKTIIDHTNIVNSLLFLKDKRVASCSLDNTIRIYNPSNDYKCQKVIERHSEGIKSICQLDDGTIISCSDDKSIMIGDYTINNAVQLIRQLRYGRVILLILTNLLKC